MKSIVITGAAKGFGHALTAAFCREGWFVYPVVRNEQDCHDLRTLQGDRCRPLVGDVSHDSVRERLHAQVSTGALDVLINNAGLPAQGAHLADVSPASIAELMQVHCLGALRCAQACLPLLRNAPAPLVINVNSRLGSLTRTMRGDYRAEEHSYAYRIAKAAQNMLTACMATDSTMQGITVASLHPGRMATALSQSAAMDTPTSQADKLCRIIVEQKVRHGAFLDLNDGEIEW